MKTIINGNIVLPEEIARKNLVIRGDRIAEITESVPEGSEVIDAAGLFVAPGFVDEHVHGYSAWGEGFDITADVAGVAAAHLKHGTTSITPSPSYSLRLGGYLSVIEQCNSLIAAGSTNVEGVHLEGPYINPHMGAGRKYAWKFIPEIFEQLFVAGGKNILHCTYAPEMPWAAEVEDIILSHGVVMDIGHTMAGPADIRRSVDKGARIVTHLFDATGHYLEHQACEMTGDPQDGVSYLVLAENSLFYELICDSKNAHTTANSQRLALKVAGEDKIILVTDCTCYNRSTVNPADYPEDDLRSATDLNITPAGALFGSRLTLRECAANFKRNTGVDMRVLMKCAATNSARALGIDDRVGSLEPGKMANIVFLTGDVELKRVFFRGTELSEIRN